MPTRAAVLDHDAAPTMDFVRHVADSMPDRGKRGKDITILQMGQDPYRSGRAHPSEGEHILPAAMPRHRNDIATSWAKSS